MKCGIRGVNRPCQYDMEPGGEHMPYPRSPLCCSPNEKIYVVDDDRVLLGEIAEFLGWLDAPVECFDNAIDFQKAVSGVVTGCILLDLQLPGCDGVSLQKWLQSVDCTAPVLFLSGTADISTAVDCMKAGARDFLVKPIKPGDLRAAVSSALTESRKSYCERCSAHELGTALARLTPAELNVADLLAKGYVTKQIAGILGRSENTIKIHRARVLRKLSISSTVNLAQLISLAQGGRVSGLEDSSRKVTRVAESA